VDPFKIVPCIVVAIFIAAIVIIIVKAGKGVAEWADNNSQPVLSEPARVVAKRTETQGGVAPNTGGQVSTWYYATFELPGGDRREFSIRGNEYGMLAEGDEGTLTFQGTRYHRFERKAV
jgi:hypothetical protein